MREDGCTWSDLVEELALAQSTVSQHEEAGLVRGDVDGPRVCYCIEPRALRRLEGLVGALASCTRGAAATS